MKTFTNQIDLTAAHWEGFSPTAYKDAGGVLTIGYGQARKLPDGTPITPDMTCTEEQAREWLEKELHWKRTRLMVDHNIIYGNFLNPLSDYAYNCGLNAFPKLIEKLKANDIPGALLEFLDGFYVKGKPFLGLLLRRISEYNTFLNGSYVAWEKGDPISQHLMDKLLAKNSHNIQAVAMIKEFKVMD